MAAIRIFIGSEEKTRVPAAVLEHTVRRHASRPVEVTPMIGPEWEYPIDGIKVGTGFSLRRWMIPAACGFDGYAIYLDADQILFADPCELYDLGRELLSAASSAPVLACTFQPDKYSKTPWPQTSVMVIDCGRAGGPYWQFRIADVLAWLRANPGAQNYANLMHGVGLPVAAPLPKWWNHLNGHTPGKTKLLHYTKEPEQPWYRPDHPLAHLWKAALVSALKAGAVTRADMEAALARWGVKEDWRGTNGLHPEYRKFLVSAVR